MQLLLRRHLLQQNFLVSQHLPLQIAQRRLVLTRIWVSHDIEETRTTWLLFEFQLVRLVLLRSFISTPSF